MKNLVELCLKWRLLVLALVVIVAVVGTRSALDLPIDAVPDITNVQVQVLTDAPSLGPVDVARSITSPVESAMSGLPGVEQIRSVSRFGLSAVTVVFADGTDLLRARQLISERLSQAREHLPRDAAPELGPLSSGLGEVLQFEVRGRRMCPPGTAQPDSSGPNACHTSMELRSLLDWFIAYELRSVPGVVEVNSFGGELKTYEVEVLPDRLRALDVSLNDLYEALERNNATAGGGYLVRAGEQLLVRGEGRIQSLEEIGDVLVDTREDGVPVRVRDLARVHFAPMIRQGAVTRDGRGEVVTGIVMMLIGGNGREVVQDVKKKLAQLAGLPTLEVTVDRSAASRYGVAVRDALDAIEALGGRPVGEVYEGERRFRLQVRIPAALRDDIEQIRTLPVSGADGPLVPLGQIASIAIVDSPASVSRESVRRRTSVEVNVRGRDLASFVREAQQRVLDDVRLPPGYVVAWGGQFEQLAAASERLGVAVPLALGLIFVLLYMAFGELKSAALIFLNVPFAAVGGVLLLGLRGLPLSISAGVGFIALFGIAVLNGVVLLSTIKKLRAEGHDPARAAREGAERRLRAVVMTATVAALGFLPMALSSSAGAEVQRPLATVVIGGLLSATFLTLFVLPTLYAWAYRSADGALLPGRDDQHGT